jgi:hypothetical protein
VTGCGAYDLGTADGVALAVTDALALPDGTVLVSAAAEDTPDPYEDGPVWRAPWRCSTTTACGRCAAARGERARC